MNENKNLIIALALSLMILLGWQEFFAPPATQQVELQATPRVTHQVAETKSPTSPQESLSRDPSRGKAVASVSTAQQPSPRLHIESPELRGSLALRGGGIDDIVLKKFHTNVEKESPGIRLLAEREKSARSSSLTTGWHLVAGETALPGEDTLWAPSFQKLEVGKPVTLTWANGKGVTFERILEIDEHFLLTVRQRVINNSETSLKLQPYATIACAELPDVKGQWTVHEGAVGFLNGRLEEKTFEKIKKDPMTTFQCRGGWAGITEKYWLVALLPGAQDSPQTVAYRHVSDGEPYRVETLGEEITVAQGSSIEAAYHFYIGAKTVQLLDAYEQKLNVKHFDMAIDFGYFYFLTRPLFYALVYMKDYLGGNMGACIILLTILIKLLLFPLANKSYRSMSRMKKIQPQVAALQQRYAEDKQRLSQELMALYKREGANPVGGCLPQIIQFPVLFALYKVFLVSIELRHAPMWWIRDLSAPDPYWITNAFGLIPWTPFEFLQVGIWPLLMGITMFVQQKMSPPPADPAQAKMFLLMPLMFTFMLAQLPAGLVMYWTWSNLLSIAQQWLIMCREERQQRQEQKR